MVLLLPGALEAAVQVVAGSTTSGNTTFMSLAEWPASMPGLPPSTQARSPTEPLGPMEIEPLGPVLTEPLILALPTLREFTMVSSVTTSPWAKGLFGNPYGYPPVAVL